MSWGWPHHFPSGVTTGQIVSFQRENVRSNLAYIVIMTLVVLVAAVVVLVAWRGAGEEARFVVAGVLTPIIGIAGTVLGFYFGAETQRRA